MSDFPLSVAGPSTVEHTPQTSFGGFSRDQPDVVFASIEQFDKALEELKMFIDVLPDTHKPKGLEIFKRLCSVYELYNSGDIEAYNQQSTVTLNSKIARLGLGGPLLKDRGTMPNTALAKKYGVSPDTVKRFFEKYDSLPKIEQARQRRTSIFDIEKQLEMLNVTISRSLLNVEGSDPESHVRYLGELRQTISLANNVLKDIHIYEKVQKLHEKVVEILKDELPHKQTKVMQVFQAELRTL